MPARQEQMQRAAPPSLTGNLSRGGAARGNCCCFGAFSTHTRCTLLGLDRGRRPGADLRSAERAELELVYRLDPSRRRDNSPTCRNEPLIDRGGSLAEHELCWAQAEPAASQS